MPKQLQSIYQSRHNKETYFLTNASEMRRIDIVKIFFSSTRINLYLVLSHILCWRTFPLLLVDKKFSLRGSVSILREKIRLFFY